MEISVAQGKVANLSIRLAIKCSNIIRNLATNVSGEKQWRNTFKGCWSL